MTITKTDDNGKITIVLEGWLDHESSPQLGEVIEALTSAEELTIDFGKVEYISSAGIRMLVTAHRKAKELNAMFRVIHANSEVMSILGMTGLDKKLGIEAD